MQNLDHLKDMTSLKRLSIGRVTLYFNFESLPPSVETLSLTLHRYNTKQFEQEVSDVRKVKKLVLISRDLQFAHWALSRV